eukprot:TRINITY_DN25713_c0_g1_i1.p1 TRINITY_DN25713_c0_g1~~TRINITY_DN25713_c0_g1_i1.p1  ORF type:complete len:350 (+),score=47.30 TRINITY_DN25713_c0_g1_i1:72-1121(+)
MALTVRAAVFSLLVAGFLLPSGLTATAPLQPHEFGPSVKTLATAAGSQLVTSATLAASAVPTDLPADVVARKALPEPTGNAHDGSNTMATATVVARPVSGTFLRAGLVAAASVASGPLLARQHSAGDAIHSTAITTALQRRQQRHSTSAASTGLLQLIDNMDKNLSLSWAALLGSIFVWGIVVTVFAYRYHTHRSLPAADKPSKDLEQELAKLTTWKYGLCTCAVEPSMFAFSLFCPVVHWADTLSVVGITTFWTAFGLFFGISVMNALTTGVVFWIALACTCAYFRNELRRTFGMRIDAQTIIGDFFIYLCCVPCAITQEARHVKEAARCRHEAIKQVHSKEELPNET